MHAHRRPCLGQRGFDALDTPRRAPGTRRRQAAYSRSPALCLKGEELTQLQEWLKPFGEGFKSVFLARDQGEYSLSSGHFSLYSLVAGEESPAYINFLPPTPRLKVPRHKPTNRPSRNAIGPKCHRRCHWLNQTWRLSCRNSLDRFD